jgi:hypothetical protein
MKNKKLYFNLFVLALIVIGLIITYNSKQSIDISPQSNPPTFSQ